MKKLILVAALLASCDRVEALKDVPTVTVTDCVRIDIASGGLARYCRWEPEPGVVCWVSSLRETISCVRK